MKLISWNIMGGYGGHMSAQAEELCKRAPDIIALQEVTAKVAPAYRELLARGGYYSIVDSFQYARYRTRLRSGSFGELIASRWPLITSPVHFDVPWPEKVLSCFCIGPWGDVQVHTAHVPKGDTNDVRKIQMLEGIYKGLAFKSQYPRILCGDFGTPQEELVDGRYITWGKKHKRTGEIVLHKYWGQRWDAGERHILEGLAEFDLEDVYRKLNAGRHEASFIDAKDRRTGRRYDHVFASAVLNPQECRYLHFLREWKLSEHSAIEAVFAPILSKTNPASLIALPGDSPGR